MEPDFALTHAPGRFAVTNSGMLAPTHIVALLQVFCAKQACQCILFVTLYLKVKCMFLCHR